MLYEGQQIFFMSAVSIDDLDTVSLINGTGVPLKLQDIFRVLNVDTSLELCHKSSLNTNRSQRQSTTRNRDRQNKTHQKYLVTCYLIKISVMDPDCIFNIKKFNHEKNYKT